MSHAVGGFTHAVNVYGINFVFTDESNNDPFCTYYLLLCGTFRLPLTAKIIIKISFNNTQKETHKKKKGRRKGDRSSAPAHAQDELSLPF